MWTVQDDPIRRTALRRELAELLRTVVPALRAVGFPEVVRIEPVVQLPRTRTWIERLHLRRSPYKPTRRELYTPEKWQSLGTQRAWPLGLDGMSGEAYLGVDGTVYSKTQFGWSRGSLDGQHATTLQRAIGHLRRLLRAHAPAHAFPERIDCFGAEFTTVPRVVATEATSAQRQAVEEELRCENPPNGWEPGGRGASRHDPGQCAAPPGREQQIRHLLLSWLRVVTATGFWLEPRGHPQTFLEPSTPYALGGPVKPEEARAATEELLAAGLAEWVDAWPLVAAAQIDQEWHRSPPWRLILTEPGMRQAQDEQARFADTARLRGLRMALLGWVGQHATGPHTVSLDAFLGSPSSVVDGIASTMTEVHRAARWLANHGWIHQTPGGIPAVTAAPIPVSLTHEGLVCIDEYGGDPWAMRAALRRGDTLNVRGNVAIASQHFSQHADMSSRTQMNVDALRDFAQAVLHNLPKLELDSAKQQEAQRQATEILTETDQPESDHSKLRALLSSLRAILEGAAGNALAEALLHIGRP